MRRYVFDRFGLDNLRIADEPPPEPSRGEVLVSVKALSLNYRDLVVIEGRYNPRLPLPATPISDAAGIVVETGPGVDPSARGMAVMTHFLPGWRDGPFRAEYRRSSLGAPGPGLAAETVVLPAEAVTAAPRGLDLAEAATLPVASLTAWNALFVEGDVGRDRTVLTLGTGGVSVFALQLAKAAGARVIITSGSDAKLARARDLGADGGINYTQRPDWDSAVLELTGGDGVDLVVETGGIGTLERSLRAVRAGGVVALCGSLTGLEGKINIARAIMNRVRIAGFLVGSLASFQELTQFVEAHGIRPVVDRRFPFDCLEQALRHLAAGLHFGKVVVEV